jgi:uncharacterized damage-inducible protein DinB
MTRLGMIVLAAGAVACGQTTPEPPPVSSVVTDSLLGPYEGAKSHITRAAEQMPEADYGFKPAGTVDEVRTYGRILAHIADANYMFCSVVSGEAPPSMSVEETKSTKADITGALGDSFAFCDRAFGSVNDQTGAMSVRIAQLDMDSTKLGALALNTAHDLEHYGNLVTYLRAKGLVPPSSQ